MAIWLQPIYTISCLAIRDIYHTLNQLKYITMSAFGYSECMNTVY